MNAPWVVLKMPHNFNWACGLVKCAKTGNQYFEPHTTNLHYFLLLSYLWTCYLSSCNKFKCYFIHFRQSLHWSQFALSSANLHQNLHTLTSSYTLLTLKCVEFLQPRLFTKHRLSKKWLGTQKFTWFDWVHRFIRSSPQGCVLPTLLFSLNKSCDHSLSVFQTFHLTLPSLDSNQTECPDGDDHGIQEAIAVPRHLFPQWTVTWCFSSKTAHMLHQHDQKRKCAV